MAHDALSDRDKFINHWEDTLGREGAEASWLEKVKHESGPKPKVPMFFGIKDIHYQSPIDGREITNMAARRDDLARSGCIEYDPEMRKDTARFRASEDKKLEDSVDTFVEKEWESMPLRKKETLAAELESGIAVETVRQGA